MCIGKHIKTDLTASLDTLEDPHGEHLLPCTSKTMNEKNLLSNCLALALDVFRNT